MKKFYFSCVLGLFAGSAARAAVGTANVHGTAPNSAIQGTVRFEDTKEGLHVTAHLSGLPPGPHGFHIHEFGLCDDMGKAAGAHYNPFNQMHGEVTKGGAHHAHAGDLGNISVNSTGQATLDSVIPDVKLAEGQATVGGRAVVIHEKADDFSQPSGNAGGRIACALIVLTGGK